MILRSSVKRIIDVLKEDCHINEFEFYEGSKTPDLVAIRRIIAYIVILHNKTTTTKNLAAYFKVTDVAVRQGNQIVHKKLKEKKDLIFLQLYDKIYTIMQNQKLVN